MLKAYKYCLLPTAEKKLQIAKFFGSCRFVYNLGLECKMQAWSSARKHLTCIDLANQMKELKDLSRNNVVFLILSGLATGLSWIFYFKALQLGNVSQVAAIDKLSVVITIILSIIFLKEALTVKTAIGAGLIILGSLVLSIK